MTSTAQSWCDRTRTYLMSGLQEERNKLSQDYTAAGSTLHFTYPLGGVVKGARLAVGLNTFYVWDVGADGMSATVSGGEEGSTDANAATGTVIRVRPRFTDSELFTALNEELGALSSPQSGLFQVKTFDITYNASIDGYDLTAITDLQSIYEVRYQEPGPGKDWPRVPNHMWRLDRSALTTDFASGNALKLFGGGAPGFDVRLVYKAPLTALTNLATTTASTGISTAAADIPPLGAAIRMMTGREVKRNFTESQPDTRRHGEVPPGAVFNSQRGFQIQYAQRLAAEQARLAALYPAVTH